ncbi:MAG TPA: hypothetical protein VG408_07985, partial [Actinomycetota bacterium]|nr:hypothetical protein [Actinomycetota bacterium]
MHRRAVLTVTVLGSLGSFLGTLDAARAQPASSGVVDLAEVRGLIDAPVAEYILERVAGAERDGAEALILQLDSSGALDVDVDRLVAAVDGADVPIVAWVAPRGARVESAAIEIADAADLLFVGTDVRAPDPDASAAALQDVLRELDGRNVAGRTLETWDE